MPRRIKPPKRVGDLIESALATKKLRRQYRWARVRATWEQIVGPALAARTTPVKLKLGVLEVTADAPEVLAILQEKLDDIQTRLSTELGKEITLKLNTDLH